MKLHWHSSMRWAYAVSLEIVDIETDVYKEYMIASGARSNRAVPPKKSQLAHVVEAPPPPVESDLLDSGETTASTPSENDTVHNEVKSKEPISSDARMMPNKLR